MSLLDVSRLSIAYPNASVPVVEDVSFSIGRGEAVGMIGESGSGKTQTALALLGLLPADAVLTGSVRIDGNELVGLGPAQLNRYRPCRIAMVFQDPLAALNPYLSIGEQLQQILLEHKLAAGRDVAARVLEMLRRVGLPDPGRQMYAYPHQLSGGMRQRAMIAAALLGEPDLLVADEPTTALDVTVQAQILQLLRELRREFATALLLITHDLGIVAGNCQHVLVLDQGRLVEQASVQELYARPVHERTRAMLAASPGLDATPVLTDAPGAPGPPLLTAQALAVSHFEKPYGSVWKRTEIKAVQNVGLQLRRGETLALVGESGSGKTSLARALLGLVPIAGGTLQFNGQSIAMPLEKRSRDIRRQLGLVFQDPAGSLNPAMRVNGILAEPLKVHQRSLGAAARALAVQQALARVGLRPDIGERFPHQLSGGQAQRVAIARALILKPQLLICDEAVAALDGSARHEILALLQREQRETGLALLFITHDLGVVKRISHRVMVMYMGRICEEAASARLFAKPQHPYTRALIDSVPLPDPAAAVLPAEARGEVASLQNPPAGCAFHPRCRYAQDRCRRTVPVLERGVADSAACHRSAELDLGSAQSNA